MRLENKRAVVTAAGQGIGKATALAFAREGAKVYASDINPSTLAELAQSAPEIETDVLDVTDAQAVADYAKRRGPVDVLFNCAGFVDSGSILQCDDAAWERSFELNVHSMFHTISAFLPSMLEAGGGSIVNMASICSSEKGLPNRFIYGTTKAAVIGLTKSVAADFVGKGVRCNAIAPGTVLSPSLEDRINALPDPVAARKDFIARQPMGRLGRAEEIAAAALYLASDDSAFTTGTVICIDGGISI